MTNDRFNTALRRAVLLAFAVCVALLLWSGA